MAITSRNYIQNAVISKDTKLVGTLPTELLDIASTAYVDNKVAAQAPIYSVLDGVYITNVPDPTPTSVRNLTSYSVGDVVIAFETVGPFTADKIYRCTADGSLTTGTFELITAFAAMQIVPTVDIITTAVPSIFYIADTIYLYDQETAKWKENGQYAVKGLNIMAATVNYDSPTAVAFPGFLPPNAQILNVTYLVIERYDGTGNPSISIGIGTGTQLANYIMSSGDFGDFLTYPKYFKGIVNVLDSGTADFVQIGGRTRPSIYYTAPTGATKGSIKFYITYFVL